MAASAQEYANQCNFTHSGEKRWQANHSSGQHLWVNAGTRASAVPQCSATWQIAATTSTEHRLKFDHQEAHSTLRAVLRWLNFLSTSLCCHSMHLTADRSSHPDDGENIVRRYTTAQHGKAIDIAGALELLLPDSVLLLTLLLQRVLVVHARCH